MTRREIKRTSTGSVVVFDESPAERAERVDEAGKDAARQVHFTPGQRRVLAKVQERARRATS